MYVRAVGLGAMPETAAMRAYREGVLPSKMPDFFQSFRNLGAAVYSWWNYGKIPLPATPAPGAPETREEMTVGGAWTPEQAATRGQERTIEATRQRIIAAQRSGEYVPEGRLPISATEVSNWFERYQWPLVIAAGLLLVMGTSLSVMGARVAVRR